VSCSVHAVCNQLIRDRAHFKSIFTPYGMVEHSSLLSQLDGMGRRRGFVLMSTHREAVTAMEAEGGRYVE
jgi:hypothetical protein